MDAADSLLDLNYLTALSGSSSISRRGRRRTYSRTSWHGKVTNNHLSVYSIHHHRSAHSVHSQVAGLSKHNVHETDYETASEESSETEQEQEKDMDGGTAWLSVLGAFLAHAMIGGIEKSFGILYIVIQQEFGSTPLQTTWIGSLASTLRFLLGVFGGMLIQRFGARRMTFAGATLYVLGLLTSSFVRSSWQLYITYGLFVGVGASFIYLSITLLVNERFIRLRARANGIAMSGSGLGSFSIPILMQFLLDQYGFSGEMLIMAGICANYFVAVALFWPKRKSEVPEIVISDNVTDSVPAEDEITEKFCGEERSAVYGKCKAFLKEFFGCGTKEGEIKRAGPSSSFLVLCISLSCVFMGYVASVFFLPSIARSKGINPTSTAYLLSTVGISDMMGRLASGLFFDIEKFVPWRKHIYAFTFMMMSITNLSIPFCTAFYQFVICAMIFGFFTGICVAQRAVICIEMVGEESLKKFYGVLITSQGAGVLVGPAIASALYQYFGTFSSSYYFCCAVQGIAAMLFSLDLLVQGRKNSAI